MGEIRARYDKRNECWVGTHTDYPELVLYGSTWDSTIEAVNRAVSQKEER